MPNLINKDSIDKIENKSKNLTCRRGTKFSLKEMSRYDYVSCHQVDNKQFIKSIANIFLQF
jgi:hypothetical protein